MISGFRSTWPNAESAATAKAAGMRVERYTVDTGKEAARMKGMAIYAIKTGHPDRTTRRIAQ